mgnify:CR=1 FL=1
MGITHVVRGQDHVSNTPRQVMILRGLGEEPAVAAHDGRAARPGDVGLGGGDGGDPHRAPRPAPP